MHIRRTSLLVCFVTFTIFLSGCGSDPGFDETVDFATTDGTVQFINMMPDSPEVTIIHELTQSLVKFPFATSPEIRVVDKYEWRIAYIGPNNEEVTVARGEDQQITENFVSTFLIMGTTTQDNVQVVNFELLPVDQRPVGQTEVWFAANLTNHAMVDIYVTEFGADITASTALTTINSGGWTDLIAVPAAAGQQITVTIAATSDVLYASTSLTFPEQSRELFALVDDFGPDSANHIDLIRTNSAAATTIVDISQPKRARAGNFSNKQPVTSTLGSLQFPPIDDNERTESVESTESGSQVLTVTSGQIQLESSFVNLLPGTDNSILIFNDPNSETQPATRTLIAVDQFRAVRDRALFQFVSGSSDLVDFYALSNGRTLENTAPLFNDVQFAASGIAEASIGPVEFIVTSPDGATTLQRLSVILIQGATYTVVYDSQGTIHSLIN